jgi:iron(III) transport system ATP-binding protein
VLGIVGGSGSGKTSLLRVLAGKLEPEKGEVLLDNLAIARPSERLIPGDERVSLLAQDFDLNQYVKATAELYGNDIAGEEQELKRGKRLQRALGLVLEDQQTHQISGGQKQRIALGKAVLGKPRLLLLDEPFSNLDYPLKAKLQQLILQKWKAPLTVLVTHEPDDVLSLCTKLLVLKEGKVVQFGTVRDVYERPKSLYVANLLGPVNKVSTALCEALGVQQLNPKRQTQWIRPHVLTLSDNGVRCVVEQLTFGAAGFKVYCSCADFEESLLVYTMKQDLKVGDEICVSVR